MEKQQIKIAFYKGDPGRLHRFIRWWTKSKYSHAELVMPDGETWWSISPFLDSDVSPRHRPMLEHPDRWDYLTFDLNWRKPVREYQMTQLNKFIEETRGHRYDWIGMLLSQCTPFLIKRRDKWYCSEWIAHALVNSRIVMWDNLKIYDTPDMSPGKLYDILLETKLCNEAKFCEGATYSL